MSLFSATVAPLPEECLARDPFAHRFPWNVLPVDLVQVHEFLRYPVSPQPTRANRSTAACA
jgi:hypothetical protein